MNAEGQWNLFGSCLTCKTCLYIVVWELNLGWLFIPQVRGSAERYVTLSVL